MNKNFLKVTTILCSLASLPAGLFAEEYTSKNGKTVDVETYADQYGDVTKTATGVNGEITKTSGPGYSSASIDNSKEGRNVWVEQSDNKTEISAGGEYQYRAVDKEVDSDGDINTTIRTNSGTEVYDDTLDGTKVLSIRKGGVHEVQVTPDGKGTATYTTANRGEGTAKKNTDGNTTTLTTNSDSGATTTTTKIIDGDTTTVTVTPDNGGNSKYISKTSENGMNKYQTSGGRTRVEKQHNLPKK